MIRALGNWCNQSLLLSQVNFSGQATLLVMNGLGAAPTAHTIEQLEKKGIKPVHVYGLTYVID